MLRTVFDTKRPSKRPTEAAKTAKKKENPPNNPLIRNKEIIKEKKKAAFFGFSSSRLGDGRGVGDKAVVSPRARYLFYLDLLRVFFIGVFLFARLSKHCKSMIKVFFELFGIVEGQAQSLSERAGFGWAHPDPTLDRCPSALPLRNGAKG